MYHRIIGALVALASFVGSCDTTSTAPPAPPLDSIEAINATAAEHDYADLDTAMRVIQATQRLRGWSEHDIERFARPLRTIVQGESAGCFNLRRGAKFSSTSGAGCALKQQGKFSDSGYGQVLMSLHGKWLCPQEGLCSPADVVATPYASATAFVALVERSGLAPWCYTAKLRANKARCSLPA